MILLHYTGMATGGAAEDRLCDPASEVSSHYIVHEDGRVVQMVREADRAWHAGRGSWGPCTDINSCSVGIEIVNPGHEIGYVDFPHLQVEAVVALCLGIAARHGVPPRRVLGHSDTAPGRKLDPGERFPWSRLHAAGLGLPIPHALPQGPPVLALGDQGEAIREVQRQLARIGYGVELSGVFDQRMAVIVEAFQRHFRPACIDGRMDAGTRRAIDYVHADAG